MNLKDISSSEVVDDKLTELLSSSNITEAQFGPTLDFKISTCFSSVTGEIALGDAAGNSVRYPFSISSSAPFYLSMPAGVVAVYAYRFRINGGAESYAGPYRAPNQGPVNISICNIV